MVRRAYLTDKIAVSFGFRESTISNPNLANKAIDLLITGRLFMYSCGYHVRLLQGVTIVSCRSGTVSYNRMLDL